MLLEILSPYFENAPKKEYGGVTKADFYSYGLSGRENSQEKRKALLRELNLPVDMSPNATLQAVNMLFTKEEFIKLMEK
jgi:ribonuclease M5